MPTTARTAKSALLAGVAVSVGGASFDCPPTDGPALPPDEFSKYLWEKHRIQRSPRRLAQLRLTGGGPPYVRDGCVVRYPPKLGDIWAAELLGEPVRSTAEESARKLIEPT